MSVARTIKCDVDKCNEQCTEKVFGEGFPGWGELHGKIDTETGSTGFGLCPRHHNITFNFVQNLRG